MKGGSTMEPIKVTLVWTKETKGTHRYDMLPNDRGDLRTLYVPKAALPLPRPDSITVTVEWDA
jgi:hypothetical protein